MLRGLLKSKLSYRRGQPDGWTPGWVCPAFHPWHPRSHLCAAVQSTKPEPPPLCAGRRRTGRESARWHHSCYKINTLLYFQLILAFSIITIITLQFMIQCDGSKAYILNSQAGVCTVCHCRLIEKDIHWYQTILTNPVINKSPVASLVSPLPPTKSLSYS